jgi:hypothetical protein
MRLVGFDSCGAYLRVVTQQSQCVRWPGVNDLASAQTACADTHEKSAAVLEHDQGRMLASAAPLVACFVHGWSGVAEVCGRGSGAVKRRDAALEASGCPLQTLWERGERPRPARGSPSGRSGGGIAEGARPLDPRGADRPARASMNINAIRTAQAALGSVSWPVGGKLHEIAKSSRAADFGAPVQAPLDAMRSRAWGCAVPVPLHFEGKPSKAPTRQKSKFRPLWGFCSRATGAGENRDRRCYRF